VIRLLYQAARLAWYAAEVPSVESDGPVHAAHYHILGLLSISFNPDSAHGYLIVQKTGIRSLS
jgi:hypothetical protein